MLIVQNISPQMVASGGTVRLSGSGFDSRCNVVAGSQIMPVLDYGETWLEFSAPSAPGAYTVTIARDGYSFGEFSLTVVSLRNSETWNIAPRENVKRDGLDVENEEFRNALLGLMPRGFAWFTGKMGNWWKLFSAFSLGFSAVYSVFRLLVDESSPAKTTSYEEWERELGLPINGLEQRTDGGRLAEIYRVARKQGGCTVPYFKSIAALFGINVGIYEYFKNPEKFEGVDFGYDDPNFYWMLEIEAESEDWHACTCNDTCNDYLQYWWNAPMESLFDTVKPAHTKLLYAYKEVERELVVVDDSNNVVVVNDNTPIVASILSGHIVNPVPIELPSGENVLGIRVKDLPDAQNDEGYFVRDSEAGGTVKADAMDQATLDELWDTTDPEDDNNG